MKREWVETDVDSQINNVCNAVKDGTPVADSNMKFYKLFTNNGDWGGCWSRYVLADGKDNAEASDDWYIKAKHTPHVDCSCHEVSEADLLQHLLLTHYDDKYVLQYKILTRSNSQEL